MPSTIVRLSVPVEEASNVAGWDETIDGLWSHAANARTSICTHALAHQHSVYGIRSDIVGFPSPSSDSSFLSHSSDWISWKTSLAPHRVCQVVSNRNGALLAVALDNGTLSVLRGSDGVVLATRRVAPEGTSLPPTLAFVSDPTANPTTPDALLILPPEDGPPILVSNMQGERLNSVESPGIVAEAARSMGLHALRLEGCDDIRAIQGFILPSSGEEDGKTLRLAVVDGNGHLAIYDYSIQDKPSKPVLVQREVDLGLEDSTDMDIDLDVGLRVQFYLGSSDTFEETNASGSFLLLSLSSPDKTKLCWLDWQSLDLKCQHTLRSDRNVPTKRPRLLALEPIPSIPNSDSVALVATIKFFDESARVEARLIQASIGNVFGDVSLSDPHDAYTIPVPSTVESISIASISESVPYSFRCTTWSGETNYESFAYLVSTSKGSVGSVRLHCSKQNFAAAMEDIENCGAEYLSNDAFGRFHPAEVALRRWELVLHQGVLNDEAREEAHQCLQLQILGAISGKQFGDYPLKTAIGRILRWPDKHALQRNPSLSEVVQVLEDVTTSLASVSDELPGSLNCEKKLAAIQERLIVLEYLKNLLESRDPSSLILDNEFASIRTFNDLFSVLVNKGIFNIAERMWISTVQTKLSPDAMVSAFLAVSSKTSPRKYAGLLSDIVFPSLSISHEMLPLLLSWACKMADQYDEDSEENANTLDDAIFLLELCERSTKELRLRVHSSYAMYSPFIETSETKRRKIDHQAKMTVTASSLADISTLSDASQLDIGISRPPSTRKVGSGFERPNPTILDMGRLQGGAKKARLGIGASMRGEAIDETEETVETKLASARSLKEARAIGLDPRIVTLASFSQCGGAQHIVKLLVQKFSRSSTTHEDRVDCLCNIVQPFCGNTGTDFDEALISYVQDQCRGKDTSKAAIEESASIARCGIVARTKCEVTLIALRAALFCRFSPPWLSDLSNEALEWAAGDSTLRSELEEASRLLRIDEIVGRYCGEGAKELFHVDNPRHAMRLLEFVTTHFQHDAALPDALSLCEAFAHLSREDACTRIIQNAIIHGDQLRCGALLEESYQYSCELGIATFSKVVAFCLDEIEKDVSRGAVACGLVLAEIALTKMQLHASNGKEGFSVIHYDERTLEALVEDLRRLKALKTDHGLSLSLRSLRSPKQAIRIATSFCSSLVGKSMAGDAQDLSHAVSQSKRALAEISTTSGLSLNTLWFASVGSNACKLALKANDDEVLTLLSDLGIFDELSDMLASRSCLSVALSLCHKASMAGADMKTLGQSMKHIVRALALLQDHVVPKCPPAILERVMLVVEVCELATHTLFRSDEGLGEELDAFRKCIMQFKTKQSKLPSLTFDRGCSEGTSVARPTLHPTWYVGDGLLLPPQETLVNVLQYCRQALNDTSRCDAFLSLHEFLCKRGSYSLSLRLLTVGSAHHMCVAASDPSIASIDEYFTVSVVNLAERSVGGTGTGITSGVVDSQLAVSTLLTLPLKTAFKVFRSTLPTAISTRAFERVMALASIGIAAGNGDMVGLSSLHQWKRQTKFVQQCRTLSLRAYWWKVLQDHKVHFDPHSFQESDQGATNQVKSGNKYVESLMSSLVQSLHKSQHTPDAVVKISVDFAEAFSIRRTLPIQAYMEILLVGEGDSMTLPSSSDDVRFKFGILKGIVSTLLRQISSLTERVHVLRKCISLLEAKGSACEYERLAVVFSLYQSEVLSFLENKELHKDDIKKIYVSELRLVERRQDALAILSWFYDRNDEYTRPAFSSFFRPLPSQLGDPDCGQQDKYDLDHIIGISNELKFDPLKPLEEVLSSKNGNANASALATLCFPLGIPRGYVHAKCLVARFRKSEELGVTMPSFENDVLPVLARLEGTEDVANLAEWCASMYSFKNEDKLRCIDHAMTLAVKTSCAAEAYRGPNADEVSARALERVKRIDVAKNLLADRLSISAILNSTGVTDQESGVLRGILDTVMSKLDEEVWSKDAFVPEQFVELFLQEASNAAAKSSLCSSRAISVGQFRELSSIVYRACRSVADKYSHVQVGLIARRLGRHWLLYGDTDDSATSEGALQLSNPAGFASSEANRSVADFLPDIDEDDTINFVMDLGALQSAGSSWNVSQKPSGRTTDTMAGRLTSEEEPSVIMSRGCIREVSEYASQKASLRVAFVMSFIETESLTSSPEDNDENAAPNQNHKTTSRRLLSRLSTKGKAKKEESLLQSSTELLRIVFANSVGPDWVLHDPDVSMCSRLAPEGSGRTTRSVTFAMRHRALRAAAILCPQKALEHIIQTEELLDFSVSMNNCALAAFVAKEIEEMGLPLPHSDIVQLSAIHFPSFARTLWRHHRDERHSKGRVLLLIVEMYLKETVSDPGFVVQVLRELHRSNLYRSLLMALECVRCYIENADSEVARCFIQEVGDDVSAITRQLLMRIIQELQSQTQIPAKKDAEYESDKTVSLLVGIMEGLSESKSCRDVFRPEVERLLCGDIKGAHLNNDTVAHLERFLHRQSGIPLDTGSVDTELPLSETKGASIIAVLDEIESMISRQ